MPFFIEVFFLIVSLSLDSFISSFAYGADKIKIPIKPTLIISLVCSLALILSMLLGSLLKIYINSAVLKLLSFIILFGLGIIKLFDSFIKKYIIKHCDAYKRIEFSLFNFKFILNIYAEPVKADKDSSKILSIKEAIPLALALSFDSIAVGIGMGLIYTSYIEIFILSFIIGVISIILGVFLGNRISKNIDFDLSWISGIILIILGIFKL